MVDFAPLFAAVVPGCVDAVWHSTGGSSTACRVHWWQETDLLGSVPGLGGRRLRARALSSVIGEARRGDVLTVAGVDYTVVDAYPDGHGVTALELDG